ncbi:MAG: glycosyltransferase family 4 protein, partial [Brevinema sp.]
MKILAINWRDPKHPEAGGAEVHLDYILRYLAKNHDVTLVSTRISKNHDIYFYHGYKVWRLGHPLFFHYTFRFLWKKYFQHEGYDIIIDDISKIGVMTPTYIKNIPIVAIFHHLHGDTLFQLLPYPLAFYVKFIEVRALKKYRQTPLIVVSESSREELERLATFEDITVLSNGIDPDYLIPKKITKIPYQLCSIGRLTKAKRVDLTLEVFSKLLIKYPSARLLIVGKGPEEDHLKKMAKQLNIAHAVEFKGFISDIEKKLVLSTSEAFIFTSEKEGWGIVVIEASAFETPVFGFFVPGVKDAVKQNINGKLVSFADT